LVPLTKFATGLGLKVSFEPIAGAAAGFYEQKVARIVIDDAAEHSYNAQLATLVHELGHALVRLERHEDDPKLDYRSEEVVVESVAYSVCASLGLDTSGESVPYTAGWAGPGGAEHLDRYAELIDRLARRIFEDSIVAASGG
jgi:antirestriction protein ArdC